MKQLETGQLYVRVSFFLYNKYINICFKQWPL